MRRVILGLLFLSTLFASHSYAAKSLRRSAVGWVIGFDQNSVRLKARAGQVYQIRRACFVHRNLKENQLVSIELYPDDYWVIPKKGHLSRPNNSSP